MLIFFDIDGTLIGEPFRGMPESAKRAIEQARANGHVCVINTGRSLKLVGPDITGQTEFDGLLLGCGTMILYHGQVLFHRTFPGAQATRIIEALRRHGIDAVLEGGENNFVERTGRMFTETFARFVERFTDCSYGSFEEAVGHFDKFYAYVEEPGRMEAFQREFAAELDFVDRRGGYFEIMPKDCSKASAMRILAETLQIPMEETAAVGDGPNDIPMIECAHYGIVMGNGDPEIKEIADYVTTSVEKDGIWNALQWLGVL